MAFFLIFELPASSVCVIAPKSSASLLQRRCAPASAAAAFASSSTDFATILKSSNATKLRERLTLDPRSKISYDEFKSLVLESGFKDNEVSRISSVLTESGNIIHLPNSTVPNLTNSVFIKPNHVYQSMYHVLDIENKGVGLEKLIEMKKREIAVIDEKIAPLDTIKSAIDSKANRSAHRVVWLGLGYLVVQAGIIGRLTWWDLSWDIMEPVTYFVSFGTVLIGYTYFTLTKTEYTFEALNATLFKRKQAKFIRKQNFPIDEFNRLCALRKQKENELNGLIAASNYSLDDHFKFPSQ
eukprot:gene1531-1787_t